MVQNGVCTAAFSGTATVTVKPLPTASIEGNGGAICAGDNSGFTVSGKAGATASQELSCRAVLALEILTRSALLIPIERGGGVRR